MKTYLKNVTGTAMLLCLIIGFSSFTVNAQSPDPVQASITLKITDQNGTNGTAVAWDGEKGRYYAAIAGNKVFPIETFDASGKSTGRSEAGFDCRGLWYNPKTKTLEGNGAGEFGWFGLARDAEGNYNGKTVVIKDGMMQPEFQSVGVYDDKKKMVTFHLEGKIYRYKRKDSKAVKKIIELKLGSVTLEDININAMGYTGNNKYPYAILETTTKSVLLFNRGGKLKARTKLPADVATNSSFWFSFANNHAWLYNPNTRTWSGYKVL